MRFLRGIRLSLRALAAHPARTSLAVAGTAVGISGVVVLTAIGEGARQAVLDRIDSLGPNMLVIKPAAAPPRPDRNRRGDGLVRTLDVDDADAIASGAASIVRTAAAFDGGGNAKFGPISSPVTVVGTTPEWQQIRQAALIGGRFFSTAESSGRARVAVIGDRVRINLFGDSIDPMGRTVRIGGVPLTIIGVLKGKGTAPSGTSSEDDWVMVPLETALRRMFNRDYIKLIFVEVTDSELMVEAQQEIAAILRVRHELEPGAADDFVVQSQIGLLETELHAQTSFQRLIMGLGFLSLLVGGVGILSMMLLSVRERRSEIGLRIAVGARRRDVLLQFLAEALLLSAAGCVAGMALGVASARIVSGTTDWQADVSNFTLVVALVSSIAIGVGFGVVPAWRASALDPIDALQAE